MCITCEQTSDATAAGVEGQGDENDVYWFLFNLKSTVAWCVSGFFQAQQNPSTTLANSLCAASCDPISAAINDRLLQTNESLQYNYCESDNGTQILQSIQSIPSQYRQLNNTRRSLLERRGYVRKLSG
jgi:hypothetical protein